MPYNTGPRVREQKKVYTVRMEPSLWEALTEYAESRNTSPRSLIRAMGIKVTGWEPLKKATPTPEHTEDVTQQDEQ